MSRWAHPWTADRVRNRLSEAARTNRITAVAARAPSERTTWWPDVVHTRQEAYGYQPETAPRIMADPDQIARMDECHGWIARWLTVAGCEACGLIPDAGWLTMARASGWSWERIGRERKVRYGVVGSQPSGPSRRIPGGNSRKSLMQIERSTLIYVASQLNRVDVAVDSVALRATAPQPENRRPRGGNTIAPARGRVEIEQIEED